MLNYLFLELELFTLLEVRALLQVALQPYMSMSLQHQAIATFLLELLQSIESHKASLIVNNSGIKSLVAEDKKLLDFVRSHTLNLSLGNTHQALLSVGSLRLIDAATQLPGSSANYPETLVVKNIGKRNIIAVTAISWIKSAGNYIEIHTYPEHKRFMQRDTMANIEKMLDPRFFVRIHRSAIVRKSDIVELRPGSKGNADVILKCGTQLTLSRRNRQVLAELLN